MAAPTTAEASDEVLMEAFVHGDEQAFCQLFDRHAPALLRYARRRLPSDADAEDVVQQTFLNVHRARASFRPHSRLRPWLFTICLNLVREFHRQRVRRPERPSEQLDALPGPAPPPDGVIERDPREVSALLQALPLHLREVVIGRGLRGMEYEEVEALTGVVVPTLRVRWFRALRRLEQLAEARDAS